MEEVQITGLVVAYTQLIKGFVPEKLIPISAVVVGVALACAYDYSNSQLSVMSALKGLIIGTAATGTYAAAKDIIKK